ncbi:MFS transporter [Bacillus paralicheniformis]|nr:MFS transporter [Bacillus paralicheniformis]
MSKLIEQVRVLFTFFSVKGAFGLNLTAGQFFAPLNDTYGWDLTILSLAVSLNMITWVIFQPVMGKMIDRFGPKSVITSSAALMGSAFILSAMKDELLKENVLEKFEIEREYWKRNEKLMISILDVGKETYLQGNKGIRVFKAHEFLPEDIQKTDEKQAIQVSSFRRGLLYYE